MINPSLFLRRAVQGDAIITGAMALLLVVAAGLLAPLLNLPSSFLREVGIFLIVYAALVGLLGSREQMPKFAVWAVIATNAVWAIDSIALLFTGWVQPNLLGQAFVVAQALSVAVIAALQYVGLNRSETAVAAR
ncbi:hypothetical protein [Bradyrhizobium sp. LHD-71]|uniref:hypothetical protein n=1 Tax=Bradyrhizobium sp. LHD-71 TaxID=3072141 RepID=UPI00280EF307|nr:hypothetical protein [Bradyrhizobium sp. LHD-71]MDQ8732864.1 hypothetical protein [Bradyrhizobium sp. LHD-71]